MATMAALHGPDAQTLLQQSVHALKRTGFWSPREAHRDIVIHITRSNDEPQPIEPKDGDNIFIVVDSETTTTLLERGNDGTYFINLLLDDAANVTYWSAGSGNIKVNRFALLRRDAGLRWVDYTTGGVVESTTITYLEGQGSDARLLSGFFGVQEESYKMHTSMIHAGDRSTSHMLTRAVLTGKSGGSYDGMIKILAHARGCDAYQREETLLLSKDSRMHAEPNLEIGNEEVKCSHGVSLSRIDDEKLFYFLARGIPPRESTLLIVQGFLESVTMSIAPLQQELRAKIARRLTL